MRLWPKRQKNGKRGREWAGNHQSLGLKRGRQINAGRTKGLFAISSYLIHSVSLQLLLWLNKSEDSPDLQNSLSFCDCLGFSTIHGHWVPMPGNQQPRNQKPGALLQPLRIAAKSDSQLGSKPAMVLIEFFFFFWALSQSWQNWVFYGFLNCFSHWMICAWITCVFHTNSHGAVRRSCQDKSSTFCIWHQF